MLLNTLSFFAILFIIVFASQTEGTDTPVNVLSPDPSSFDCEKLNKNDQFPDGWDWRAVGEKLNTEACFKRIAANNNLRVKTESGRQLFEVARARPGIVTEKLFCPLARKIVDFALAEDLPILEACGADKTRYPIPVIAFIFKNSGYTLTGIDYKNINWELLAGGYDIDREATQRLWLALVAVLHDRFEDTSEESERLRSFFYYLVDRHGIKLNASTPLTELDTQIIRLLPVVIEYIMSKTSEENDMRYHMEATTLLYKALHGKIAGNQALSLYLHSRFFLNPAVDLKSELSRRKLDLPSINDTQMTKEIFAYGNNLSSISDPVERRLATAARQQVEALLFPPSKE